MMFLSYASSSLVLFAHLALIPGLVPAGQAGRDAHVQAIPRGTLLVSGYVSETVHRYLAGSGTAAGNFGVQAVPGAQRIRPGKDGLLYIVSETTNSILRFERDGTYVDAFVQDDPGTPGDETGGLTNPTGLAFGPDGRMYVGSFDGDSVLAYDGGTGAFDGIFVASQSGGLDGPDAGMCFGPDGQLWVPSFNGNQILRFSSVDGSPLGAVGSGAPLSRPRELIFRKGHLYVSSWGSNRILLFDNQGNYLRVFASSPRPAGMAFDPWMGDLYVASDQNSRVRIHNGETGVFKRNFVPSGGAGLSAATNLLWLTDQP